MSLRHYQSQLIRLPRLMRAVQRGFSLIELMIAITISLMIVAALTTLFINLSSTNTEMAKANSQIDNGRLAIQILENDLIHAGYWGAFTPQFDNQGALGSPSDTPNAVPDPCQSFATWDDAYKTNLLGIPVQVSSSVPANCLNTPASLANQQANTDVLVVRHASTCIAGSAGCDPVVNGKLYFQSSMCADGIFTERGVAQGATTNTITLSPTASTINNAYNGMQVRMTSGVGAPQMYRIASYNGSTKVATIASNWSPMPANGDSYSLEHTAQGGTANSIQLAAAETPNVNAYSGMTITLVSGAGAGQSRQISTYDAARNATVTAPWNAGQIPNNTTTYTIADHVFDTDQNKLTLHKRGADCSTAPAADKIKFVSHIYYIRNYSRSAGDGIPTLVRSEFDPGTAVALAHQSGVELIDGIQAFHVRLGIDTKVTRCGLNTSVDYTVPVNLVAPRAPNVPATGPLRTSNCTANPTAAENTLPTNRGDGIPDMWVSCGAGCTADTLVNAVAAKIYVLARNRDVTPGYVDSKTYTLDDVTVGPFNDGYKRHVFSTTVRFANISDRRSTN